jgi:hypothetical protein
MHWRMIHTTLASTFVISPWFQLPFVAIFLIDAVTIWCPRHLITKKSGIGVHLPLLVIPLWIWYESLIPTAGWIRVDLLPLVIASAFAFRRYVENLRKIYGAESPSAAAFRNTSHPIVDQLTLDDGD